MKQDIEVLILAGGKGTRLASVVRDIPKPMAPIQGVPFLELLVRSIRKQGFKQFRFLVGYKAEVIQAHFGNGAKFDIEIKYTFEPTPLGTGGAIKKGIQESQANRFLIFNGDTFFETDLSHLAETSDPRFKIALRHVANSGRYGQVITQENYQIVSFLEKGSAAEGFINAGIYFFSRDVLSYFPEANAFSIETDVMPKLAAEGVLYGAPLDGTFIDIGIPEDFQRAQTLLQVKKPLASKDFLKKIGHRLLHFQERLFTSILSLPKKYFSAGVVQIASWLINAASAKTLPKRTKPHLLILRNKYYTAGSSQVSTEYFHLDKTLAESDLATFEVLFYEDLGLSPLSDLRLLKKCREVNPHALILSSWWPTNPRHPSLEAFRNIRKSMKIQIVSLWWDTCSRSATAFLTPLLSEFDLAVVIDNPALNFFDTEAPFFDRVLPLWAPQSSSLFWPESGPKSIPVSFLGQASSYRSYRSEALTYLAERKIQGHFSTADRNQQISHEMYAQVMRSSKISINFSQSVDCNQLKSRVFEILLSGALLMESENNQINKFFMPMKDYVPFHSKEDLAEKIIYYLKHEEERQSIASEGLRKANELFSSRRFWEQILQKTNLIKRQT